MAAGSEVVRSRTNERLRWVRRLVRSRKVRRREGVWVAEGVRLCEEVFGEGLEVRLWVLEEGWADGGDTRARNLLEGIRRRGDPVLVASPARVREIADTQTPQGVVAVFRAPRWELADLEARPGPVVLLDRVQDPGNLGTIARTAEAFGAAGLVLTPGCADPGGPKALRASAGSLLRLPVVRVEDPVGWLGGAARPGAAAVRSGGMPPGRLDLTGRFTLLLGQEGAGLSPELEARARLRITVPMEGRVESLNVAATAAVVLYEAWRQRSGSGRG